MVEMDIAEGPIGTVGAYDVEFKGGFLVAKINAGAGPVSANAEVKIGADALLDAIARAIPGTIDDVILNLLKTALKL